MNGWQRFFRFTAVGFSGILVNAAAMWTVNAVGVGYVLAAVIATQTAIGWNLLLSERWVFHDKRGTTRFRARLVSYYSVNNLDLLLRIPLLVVLVETLGMRPSPANLLLVLTASVVKYFIVDRIVYRPSGEPVTRATETLAEARV